MTQLRLHFQQPSLASPSTFKLARNVSTAPSSPFNSPSAETLDKETRNSTMETSTDYDSTTPSQHSEQEPDMNHEEEVDDGDIPPPPPEEPEEDGYDMTVDSNSSPSLPASPPFSPAPSQGLLELRDPMTPKIQQLQEWRFAVQTEDGIKEITLEPSTEPFPGFGAPATRTAAPQIAAVLPRIEGLSQHRQAYGAMPSQGTPITTSHAMRFETEDDEISDQDGARDEEDDDEQAENAHDRHHERLSSKEFYESSQYSIVEELEDSGSHSMTFEDPDHQPASPSAYNPDIRTRGNKKVEVIQDSVFQEPAQSSRRRNPFVSRTVTQIDTRLYATHSPGIDTTTPPPTDYIHSEYFQPLSSTFFHAIPVHKAPTKTAWGPAIQPPLLHRAGPIPGFDRFVYLFTHPMEEKDALGPFSESGRYLTDLEIPALGPFIGARFYAPNATMLSDRGIVLPQSVQAVDLSNNAQVTDKIFSKLPASVTYLDLRSMSAVSDKRIGSLPKALKFLNLRDAQDLSDKAVAKLPRTLTHIKLNGSKQTGNALKGLPPGLKTLKINRLYKITKRTTQFLPVGLTRLDLPGTVLMREKCISYLPPTLTHLNLHSVTTFSDTSIVRFAHLASLTYLDLSNTALQVDTSLTGLPASLETLLLGSTSSGLSHASWQHLVSIKVLEFCGSEFRQPDGQPPLAQFATTLVALRMRASSRLSQHFLSELPQSLQLFNLFGHDCTDDVISLLPRHLAWLGLDAAHLTPACFASMPRRLEYLELRQMHVFTIDKVQGLPHTLRHLALDPHPENKLLLKLCGSIFPYFQGSSDLTGFEKYVFGPRDDSEERPKHEDANLWTPASQPENDVHPMIFDADGRVVAGVGYLIPLTGMRITKPWTAALPGIVNQPRANPAPYQSDSPSLSPYDIHLAYRLVSRRSHIPKPSHASTIRPNDLTDADVLLLAPNTVELIAPSATSISDIAIPSLPQGLVYLSLSRASNFAHSKSLYRIFKNCPKLSVLNVERSNFGGMKRLGKLPASLVALDLTGTTSLGDNILSKIPKTLTYLSLGSQKIGPSFPPTLTTLCLGNLHKVKESWAKALPRTLTHLDLFSAMEIEPAALAWLPRSTLIHLDLHCVRTLHESWFPDFPRNLQFLSLASNVLITDKGIEALPRHLTHLNISSTQLSVLGIAALPCYLEHLSVGVLENRVECIAYLPRGLKVLNYGGELFDTWTPFLPPMLTYLNVAYAKSLSHRALAMVPPTLTYLNMHSWPGPLVPCKIACERLAVLDIFSADVSSADVHSLPMSVNHVVTNSHGFFLTCSQTLPGWRNDPATVIKSHLFPEGDFS